MRIIQRKNKYYYLQHSFRKKDKVITKEKYLGKKIPKNIEDIKSKMLKEIDNVYKKLEKNTDYLTNSIIKINEKKSMKENSKNKIKINHIASMFTIFFNKNKKINNYKTAKQSDTKNFSKFHELLLKNGVYFPPSQFEACFLSVAHSKEDIGRTIDAVNRAINNIGL